MKFDLYTISRILGLLCLFSCLTACIDVSTIVNVNKDGSGTIEETYYIPTVLDSLSHMGKAESQIPDPNSAAASKKDSRKDKLKEKVDNSSSTPTAPIGDGLIENYIKKAESYGKGVKFVKVETLENKDTRIGRKAIFSFDDISKVSIDIKNIEKNLDDSKAKGSSNQSEKTSENNTNVQFNFTKIAGNKHKLSITVPNQIDDDKTEKSQSQNNATRPETKDANDSPESIAAKAQMDSMQQQMLKTLLAGMRIRLNLRVDGQIEKTNATFVENIQSDKAKSPDKQITLLDINFDELIKDEKLFSQLVSMPPEKSKKFNQLIKEFPSSPFMKIEQKNPVEVEFQ